jgi:uncharacterized protein YqjF (DUF2071 family)
MTVTRQNDFNYGILEAKAHRPWPMPDAPWIMTQTWHDLLFAHWPVGVTELRDALPKGFELDLHDEQAWLGIVPFHMTNVAPRGVPALPWVSAFPELNVRTYVRVNDRPGVYFFSLDAGNPLAVTAARTLFHLPYYSATMSVRTEGDWIQYDSRRTSSGSPEATLVMHYRPVGRIQHAEPGSLEYFLTERYCLFTMDSSGHASTVDIHHPPWPLQSAEADIQVNTMAEAAGFRLPSIAPLLHFSRRQDIVAWSLERLE